jgi:hypothetical protein
MTLQATIDSIDATYPVAGRDNDSQGFRDNFTTIKSALTQTGNLVEDLETKVLLKASLADNTEVDNDLEGSSINNGYYNNFWGFGYVDDTDRSGSDNNINVSAGSIQQFRVVANAGFTFIDWPRPPGAATTPNYFGIIRVHLIKGGAGDYTVTLSTAQGDVVLENGFPALVLSDTSAHRVIEAWTYNGGDTVFVRNIGTFTLPT